MSRLNWARARPYRPQESKYGIGKVLKNGAVTAPVTKDNLSLRAQHEYRDWAKTLSPRDREMLRHMN
jgi:hypothetical protein